MAGPKKKRVPRLKPRSGDIAEGQDLGLMDHPASARVPRRPDNGFERERAAYARAKHDLLAQAEGQYIVIVGAEIEGPLETFRDALRAGYRRFGLGPLYIKQVLAEEPAVEVSRDVLPCGS